MNKILIALSLFMGMFYSSLGMASGSCCNKHYSTISMWEKTEDMQRNMYTAPSIKQYSTVDSYIKVNDLTRPKNVSYSRRIYTSH
ncbi:hypothetical protein [Agarivorans sp. DSG3-1]|uniref:hypothetical protein n=1 Tax=Agarivorans sp. DSG3-1 TaxID=3342249 RepID=UPI00398E9A34